MIVCAMKSTPAIILKPILWGWAVCLTDGSELFCRALHSAQPARAGPGRQTLARRHEHRPRTDDSLPSR